VIPVTPKPAPPGFNANVYRKGRKWLEDRNYPLRGPIPKDKDGKDSFALPDYWRAHLRDLHRRYRRVCAYVSIYIDDVTGARSADHFIAKSTAIEHAYRWRNLRLACGKVNGRKGIFADILDPFEIQPETFLLNVVSGRIYPNPALPAADVTKAQVTIDRLGLDDSDCRGRRKTFFRDYCSQDISDAHLKKMCPFVWYEVHRQKLNR
jgi:uncharacterized protein (TIGR02646 family)